MLSENTGQNDVTIPCNLCGADDARVVFEAGVAQVNRVVRCERCGLMYASPRSKRPDVEEIVEWDPDFSVTKVPGYQIRRDKESLQVRDYRNSRRELSKVFPSRGRLLEVGSSYGFGLEAWRAEGWEVTGVEPNVGAARLSREEMGLDVRPVTLGEAKFDGASFDAAVMLHVIEHLPDPKRELAEVFRVLKGGGRFICETPRYDSLMFRLLGRRERSVSCDGHIYFFTVKTLAEMGRSVGFEVERVRIVGRSLTMERLAYNVGVMSKSRWVQRWIDRAGRRIGLHKIPLYLNTRDMQRITFRKA